MSQNVLFKSALLSFVFMMFMTLPAHAKVLQVKGGYSNISTQGISISDGFMGSLEYQFNKNMGLAVQYEGYTIPTVNYNIYTGYLTLHSDIVPQEEFGFDTTENDNESTNDYAYLNNYLSVYFQLGYSSWVASLTGTTVTASINGFAYGIGLDIMPKSPVGAFVGYKGASYSNTFGSASYGGLIAGIELNF